MNPSNPEPQKNKDPEVSPAMDVQESAHALDLYADMPGVDESSLEMTLSGKLFTFSGRANPKSQEGHQLIESEFETRFFRRTFTLPIEVDPEKIEATLKNGVLHVRLPKPDALQPKKISVKTQP